ncbi:TlpA family protein disulfide reductase [Streptomyces sp. NPDC021020]|uniref:TlpA family protein disulfide reductase n=1 Tax=Streptomyces sp. NPDC021020 TaxID=3365109 RepID=UPI0037B24FBE
MSPTRAPRRRTPRRAAALACVAAVASLLSACSSSSGSTSSSGSNYVSGSGVITYVKAGDRQTAPELAGKTVDGGHADLAAYKGKVVVINIWGSWCAPCRAEAPHMASVSQADVSKGVQFLGINTRDLDMSPAQQFVKHYKIPYPSLYDPAGNLILKFPKGNVNPASLPATLVVDRHGKIAARVLGALTEDGLNEMIDKIVAEK